MGGHHRTGVALFLTTAVTIYDRPTARVGRPEGRPARPASPTQFSFLQSRYSTTHFGVPKDLGVSVVSARVAMPSLSAEEKRELQSALSVSMGVTGAPSLPLGTGTVAVLTCCARRGTCTV